MCLNVQTNDFGQRAGSVFASFLELTLIVKSTPDSYHKLHLNLIKQMHGARNCSKKSRIELKINMLEWVAKHVWRWYSVVSTAFFSFTLLCAIFCSFQKFLQFIRSLAIWLLSTFLLTFLASSFFDSLSYILYKF